MSPITCLLFDLGGVLVRNVGFERLSALLPTRTDPEALKARLLASPAFRSFELGESTPDEFARSFVVELGLACDPDEFLSEFITWPQGFYPGAEQLMAKLRTRFKLACLSNSNELHWRRFNGFRDHFDVAMSSHELGLIKPDAECFQHAVTACGVNPNQVLFFDDALVNVKAARKCGILSLHVCGFQFVFHQVKALDLLPEAEYGALPRPRRSLDAAR